MASSEENIANLRLMIVEKRCFALAWLVDAMDVYTQVQQSSQVFFVLATSSLSARVYRMPFDPPLY